LDDIMKTKEKFLSSNKNSKLSPE